MNRPTTATRTPHAMDLRTEFPRSPHETLGGYVILPRTVDKCRAELAGMNGEYHWNCPLAKVFFDFSGIDPMAFRDQVSDGRSDDEILGWVQANATPRSEDEVLAWSYDCRSWTPDTVEMKAFFERNRAEYAPRNFRIRTYFDLLDAEEGRL